MGYSQDNKSSGCQKFVCKRVKKPAESGMLLISSGNVSVGEIGETGKKKNSQSHPEAPYPNKI
jgi:hypothetical protein